MVDKPLLEDLGAALPVDVAAAARQEAGDGVAAEVVDPAFLAQLPHQGVDPGEARAAVLPAKEPVLVQGGGDGVGACDEVGGGGDGGGEVPGDEADVGVADGLGERVAECGLGSEIHVTEEELPNEVSGDCGGGFAFARVGGHGVVGAPVEEADGEGAEVVVGGEEGGGLGGEGGGGGGGFGEGRGVGFVGDYGVERGEGVGFAAAVRGGGGVETEFGVEGDGEIVLGAGDVGVRILFAGALDAVDVWILGRAVLVEVYLRVAGIWERAGCRNRAGDLRQFFRSLQIVSTYCISRVQGRLTFSTWVMLIVGFPPLAFTSSSGSYSVLPTLTITCTPASLAN